MIGFKHRINETLWNLNAILRGMLSGPNSAFEKEERLAVEGKCIAVPLGTST